MGEIRKDAEFKVLCRCYPGTRIAFLNSVKNWGTDTFKTEKTVQVLVNNYKSKFSNHIREKFKSRICGKTGFPSHSKLKIHMRSHGNGKSYNWEICNRFFTCKSKLKSYNRVHTGETQYKCQVCGEQLKRKFTLEALMRIHTSDTPYECDVRSKQFTTNGNLKTNMHIHTGEKLYKYDICGSQFTSNSSFKKHIRIH